MAIEPFVQKYGIFVQRCTAARGAKQYERVSPDEGEER
jgi:hypothetical protein